MKQILSMLTFWTALACISFPVIADERAASTIHVVGRSDATITTNTVSLGDLAEVSASDLQHDEAIIGLKKIFICNSPTPGHQVVLPANTLIQRLRESGVDLQKVTYSLPPEVRVVRAGRSIGVEEISSAILTALKSTGKDASLKDVRYNGDLWVPPGELKIEASPRAGNQPGKMWFDVRANVQNQGAVSTSLEATVDEFADIPIASRPIRRGEIIAVDDVERARVNIATLPKDAIRSADQLVGLETKRDISYGETFRLDKVAIPPLVAAGAKVTMLYRNGLFEVSASGIALESGLRGQDVRVRNESSKKIVTGTVLEAGLVGVKP